MNVIEAIEQRRSFRDFKTDPVPKEIIRKILEAASCAPSSKNNQPWEFNVITGETLEKIREGYITKFRAGIKPHAERSFSGWPRESIYRVRQVNLAKDIFKVMEIGREDTKKRNQWVERGYSFFHAPVLLIICVDRMLREGTAIFDIGSVAQTFCLAATHYGLGTIIAEQGVAYPEVLREHCHIAETKQVVISVALGYPNHDFPANSIKAMRAPLDELTEWHGFD